MKESPKPLPYDTPREVNPPLARFDSDWIWEQFDQPAGRRGRWASTLVWLAAITCAVMLLSLSVRLMIQWFNQP